MSSKLRRALIGEGSAPSTLEGVLGPPPVATREIPTPEGVTLTFEIASGGDRASGFLIDLVLIGLLLLGCGFLAPQLLSFSSLLIFLQLVFFGLRCFYFSGFELLLRGRTPGKLLTRTQVIDRQGGPLRVEAIFARNLTREFEHFIPFIVLINGGAILPDAPVWSGWFAFVWAGVFGLFPLLNPERLRLGDVLAGTIVVKAPRPMTSARRPPRRTPRKRAGRRSRPRRGSTPSAASSWSATGSTSCRSSRRSFASRRCAGRRSSASATGSSGRSAMSSAAGIRASFSRSSTAPSGSSWRSGSSSGRSARTSTPPTTRSRRGRDGDRRTKATRGAERPRPPQSKIDSRDSPRSARIRRRSW